MACECEKLVKEINENNPGCNWNMDSACSEWCSRSLDLENNHIPHEDYSDEQYSCCCPSCGRIICNWCL